MKTKPTSSVTGQAPVKTTTQDTTARSIAVMKQPACVVRREKPKGSDLRGSAHNPMLSRKTDSGMSLTSAVKTFKGK
jgi:hypothetical protein